MFNSYLKELLHCKDAAIVAKLIGKEYDLSRLRELAYLLNQNDPENFSFNTKGNDEELLRSICETTDRFLNNSN